VGEQGERTNLGLDATESGRAFLAATKTGHTCTALVTIDLAREESLVREHGTPSEFAVRRWR